MSTKTGLSGQNKRNTDAIRDRIIELSASGIRASDIASTLSLTTRTVRRHLAVAEVRNTLAELHEERLAAAGRRMLAVVDTAIDTLLAVATSPASPETARVTAARSLVDYAVRYAEAAELRKRISAIEASISDTTYPSWGTAEE